MTPKTSLFRREYEQCTKKRVRSLRGRLFATHVALTVTEVNNHEMRLAYIETIKNHRGNGYASDALSWLCELADAHEITLSLCPVPLDPEAMNLLELTAWYQKFGFVRIGLNDDMIRYPHATK